MMWDRLLFAIDQFESGQTALRFAAGVAEASTADVRVLAYAASGWGELVPASAPPAASTITSTKITH